MNNDKIIIEERNRIHQIMYGKDIISEAVGAKIVGSLTEDALVKAIQKSIKNNIDEVVNKATTEQLARTATNTIDEIIKDGSKSYFSRVKNLNLLKRDIARAAYKKEWANLLPDQKTTILTQSQKAIKQMDDDVIKQSAKEARERLVKINKYNKFGITSLQNNKLTIWWNKLKSKNLRFNRAIAWKWAKRLSIPVALVLLWVNYHKPEGDPTKCIGKNQYFDEKTKKCKTYKPTPIPVDPNPTPSLYTNCYEFPYRKGCDSPIISEVQKCLGIAVDGKFGPQMEKALSLNNYGTEITEDVYNKIKAKCGSTTTITPPTPTPLTQDQTYGIEPTPQEFEGGMQTIKINADEI